jgi:hypothetical protein
MVNILLRLLWWLFFEGGYAELGNYLAIGGMNG